MLPLHGIGGRQDLPVPFGLAVGGAAVAVALSFVVLGLAWRSPKYRGNASGVPLPFLRVGAMPWRRMVEVEGAHQGASEPRLGGTARQISSVF